MTKPRVPIARPDIGEREREYVRRVMESGWISQGEWVHKAEQLLCGITGRKYALCVSSGTTALIVAMLASKSEYFVPRFMRLIAAPALTFAAVHNAIHLTGNRIAYVAADPETWQPARSESLPRIFDDAIVAPCYGHVACDGAMMAATRGRIVEDACESFGGSYQGKPAGSFGHISCISFYANKICVASEGGAVLTDDEDLYKVMRLIINHGIEDKSYVSRIVGLNGRLTDLAAAVLVAQLERMPEMVARRRDILKAYRSAAKGRWRFPAVQDGEIPAPWIFTGIPDNPIPVTEACKRENIEWRPLFPIPKDAPDTPAMRLTREISAKGMCLPLSSALTDEEVERVISIL